MNKKIIGIFVCMLLIATGVFPLVGSDTKNTAIPTTQKKNCGCADNTHSLSIFFLPPVMTEIPQYSMRDANTSSIALIHTPAYFNWMDYEGKDWTTPARDQGDCGSCWDFAAMGALESVINIREGLADLDPDLSEQYVLSCLPGAGSCQGGDAYGAFHYIRDNRQHINGTIPEACFPYQANDTVPCSEKSANWRNYLIPISNYGAIDPSQRETIKSAIMQKGPVVAPMYINFTNMNFVNWFWTHHSPDDYFPYELAYTTNHFVVIVGWKDDPSIGKGGYWICKNSWGPIEGYNGFFNIEYESLGFDTCPMIWVDYIPGSFWYPVPKANGPYYGLVNQPVQFKGNASGEHPPFTWLWDFGDQTTSKEQNPTHTYLSPGDYKVNLTVTDKNNKSFYNITSTWIQETNHPPQTPVIDTIKVTRKGAVWLCNITVNDPDGGVIYLYWDFFNVCPNAWDGPAPANEKIPCYYRSNHSGVFTMRVKAKDPYGAESNWATFKVIVLSSKAEQLSGISLFFQQLLNRHLVGENFLGP
jgi:C1A family cysteine protease